MSEWFVFALAASHAAAVLGGVWLGVLAAGNRLRVKHYQPFVPTPQPQRAKMEELAQQAQMLANPFFTRTEYVDDARDIPVTSTHRIEPRPMQRGAPMAFQGEVKK